MDVVHKTFETRKKSQYEIRTAHCLVVSASAFVLGLEVESRQGFTKTLHVGTVAKCAEKPIFSR